MPPRPNPGYQSGKANAGAAPAAPARFDYDYNYDYAMFDGSEFDLQPVEMKRAPEDQVKGLSEEQLNEVFTKVITATDPNVSRTGVRFHFREGAYKPDPNVSHLAVHFQMEGNLIHVDSAEAKALDAAAGITKTKEPVSAAALAAAAVARSEKVSTSAQVGDPDIPAASASAGTGSSLSPSPSTANLSAAAAAAEKKRALRNQFNFNERAMQTSNNPLRERQVTTEPAPTHDYGGQITQWTIFDAYLADLNAQIYAREQRDSRKLKLGGSGAAQGDDAADGDAAAAGAEGEDESKAGDQGAAADAAAAEADAAAASSSVHGAGASKASAKSADAIFFSESMARALKVVERTVNQNADAHVYWDYKYFEDNIGSLSAAVAGANANAPAGPQPAAPGSGAGGSDSAATSSSSSSSGAQTDGSSSGSSLSAVTTLAPADRGSFLPLWRFTTDKAAKPRQTVTAVVWNKQFPDLFAVGFGSYDFITNTRSGTGLVCCYSLKNAAHPEYTFETPSGVMSLDWHPTLSPLLVAGLHDGSVCVFDARKGGNKPLYSSSTPTSRHMGPVWQVAWTAAQSPLQFHSVSTDGHFCSWVVNKTDLDKEDVVLLKLAHSNVRNVGDASEFAKTAAPLPNAPVDPERALVTLGGGTCFDFNPAIPMLVVGTEEGTVSTYHTAYNSTLAQTFDGHTMAVYAVRWNHFHPNIFISCSADWTIKIWEHTTRNAVMTFDLHTPIGDVVWAPYKSTVFACVTSDGWLKLYDLAASRHEPVGEHRLSKASKLSHVAFNPRDPIIAVGDDRGVSTVLKLSSALRRMNAASVDDLEPAQEQAALDKVLIVQDENGKNKTVTLIPPLVNQKKLDEAAAAEKRAADAAAAAKANKEGEDDD